MKPIKREYLQNRTFACSDTSSQCDSVLKCHSFPFWSPSVVASDITFDVKIAYDDAQMHIIFGSVTKENKLLFSF